MRFPLFIAQVKSVSVAESLVSVRPASLADLPVLAQLELACFEADRISRRQFRHLISRGNAVVLVAELDGRVVGDLVLLFNRNTALGRIYSIAVDPVRRGGGLARKLVAVAEHAVWEHGRAWVRLEVRKDNQASIRLFESLGYRRFGEWHDYYEDHTDAWRYEKTLSPEQPARLANVPYYRQTLDFTCGPACLMMAMAALCLDSPLDRKQELRLWREATTIFMTSGHGGCGPYGLGLAAAKRGFETRIWVSDTGVHLVESVRSEDKREVMTLVQEEMLEELAGLGVPVREGPLDLAEIEKRNASGEMIIILISSWQIYEARVPHWVLITGFDERFVYLHDPFIDDELGETESDSMHMPVPRDQFERMTRYGRRGLQAVVALRAKLKV